MIIATWAWMQTPAGQAAATWGSAVLSFLAIGLALSVFLWEQHRANRERLEAIGAERRRIGQFVVEVADILNQQEADLVLAQQSGGLEYAGLHVNAGIRLQAMAALESAIPADAELALALARSSNVLVRISHFSQGFAAFGKDAYSAAEQLRLKVVEESSTLQSLTVRS